jgi:hypothetical protein
MVKSLTILAHGGKLKYRGNLLSILTLENVGIAVNYRSILYHWLLGPVS